MQSVSDNLLVHFYIVRRQLTSYLHRRAGDSGECSLPSRVQSPIFTCIPCSPPIRRILTMNHDETRLRATASTFGLRWCERSEEKVRIGSMFLTGGFIYYYFRLKVRAEDE